MVHLRENFGDLMAEADARLAEMACQEPQKKEQKDYDKIIEDATNILDSEKLSNKHPEKQLYDSRVTEE